MNLHDLFLKPYETYTQNQIIIEVLAAFFGVLSVYFSVKKNILVYPTGIISTILYVYILFNFGLLGDCMINVYYTIMSFYGWILWTKSSKDHIHVEVSTVNRKEIFNGFLLFLVSLVFVTAVYYFKPLIINKFEYTNSMIFNFEQLDWINYTDILTSSLFLVGMWLMAKRKLENWLFWIVGNLISIPMMLYKGLGITSLQYLVFTIMAIQGYLDWKNSIKKNDLPK